MEKIVYSGIIPISGDRKYILLASESDTRLFSDFGGGPEQNEKPIETAIREAWEESCAVLTRNMFDQYLHCMTLVGDSSIHYVIEVPPCLSYKMNEAYKLMRECEVPQELPCTEKYEAKWFALNNLDMNEMRPEFVPTLKTLRYVF